MKRLMTFPSGFTAVRDKAVFEIISGASIKTPNKTSARQYPSSNNRINMVLIYYACYVTEGKIYTA